MLYEVAEVLHVPPWEVGGFSYEPGHMPVCWRWWAWDFIASKAGAQAAANERAAKGY